MSIRPFLVAISVLGLAGCNMFAPVPAPSNSSNASAERNESRDKDGDERREDRGRDDRADDDRGSDRRDNPELERELRAEAAQMRDGLPRRDGLATLYNVETDGLTLISSMRHDNDLDDGSIRQMRELMEERMCASSETRGTLREGIVYVFNVEDSEGEEFSITIDRC